jgi:hypothetical protein
MAGVSCCLDSSRLKKQRPPFNGAENRKLHGRLASVSTDFMLNLIAYNLTRIPKLLTA